MGSETSQEMKLSVGQSVFTAENLLHVAKRHNNKKRKYILVNPWQGKHLPVSPTLALSMMKALGDKVAARYGGARLVIGFAETATAIGAAVAESIHDDCLYLQTTREDMAEVRTWVEFLEEHSHAPEQKLAADGLQKCIEGTDIIIFVDDEISTGKTLCNMIAQLKVQYPVLERKKLVAVSILNRLSGEDEQRLRDLGMECEWLVKLPQEDYAAEMAKVQAYNPALLAQGADIFYERCSVNMECNPRSGVRIGRYFEEWELLSGKIYQQLDLDMYADTLVLGTEECMLPGLILGRELERRGAKVCFHATTRSPIGISDVQGYPIWKGWEIRSLYDESGARKNYIYDLQRYAQVIIVSDTFLPEQERIQSLLQVLKENGCGRIIYVGRSADV